MFTDAGDHCVGVFFIVTLVNFNIMKAITLGRHANRRIFIPETNLARPVPRLSVFDRLQAYIAAEQASENRFKWPALAMATQAFLITPLLSFIVIFTGNWVILWIAVTASMYATFIPILAGLSVRQVLQVYFINLAVSMVIIVIAVLHFVFS